MGFGSEKGGNGTRDPLLFVFVFCFLPLKALESPPKPKSAIDDMTNKFLLKYECVPVTNPRIFVS